MFLSRFKHFIFFLLLPFCIHAQFVDYGTDPAHLKWNYVKTPHYKIIYPRGIDSVAYRYTQLLENVYPHLEKTIGKPVKARYPAILHPGNMLSNGMVAWAPKRMELITTPSSDLYAQSWDRQLAIHESRHIFQTGKLMKGIFRPLYYLGGEQVSGLADFAVPRWFFEGDAVVIETAMSNSGRGRMPEFNLYYRTQYLSNDFYSFDKWFMGSYKDYTGTFYALGYDMTAYARYAYGEDIWDKVTDRYTRRILHLPPFSKALKYYTGIKTPGLFNETFDFLGKEWEQQYNSMKPFTQVSQLSPEVNKYTSYQYPYPLTDSTVLAVKTSFHDITSLVLLQNGKEQFISYPGSINSRIWVKNNRVYWTEYISGLRWTHENYSVLKYLDLSNRKITTLTPRQRYLSPAINQEGSTVAVSEYRQDGRNHIVLLDTENGNIKESYIVPTGTFLKELAFDGEQYITGLAVSDLGLSIIRLNRITETWEEILPPGSANITSISVHNGNTYFESGVNGINNIYRLDHESKKAYRLTSAPFGMFQPITAENGEDLIVANYQPQGYTISKIAKEELSEEETDFSAPFRFTLAETVADQEKFNLDTAHLQQIPFEPKPYRKLAHLFNVHSWAPFYYDVNEAVNINTDDFTTIVKPGATIISQNQLNTTITQAGVFYKDNDWHGKLSFTYMGWYPIFELNTEYGGKTYNIHWQSLDVFGTYANQSNRKLITTEAKVYIPFNLTNNHYVKGIQPSFTYYHNNNRYQQIKSGKMRDFQYILGEVRFYKYRKMAQQEILPRWGYQMRLQYLHTPFHTENYGDLYTARLTTYWPGILRDHSLMIRAGYQYQPAKGKAMYLPVHTLETPRGYNFNYRTHHQYLIRGDYAFSFLYPDVSLGTIAYIQRLRANIFYDIARTQGKKGEAWSNQSSCGADVIADWNIFRLNYPISLGARIIAPINYGSVQVEGLFSVTF